VAKQRKLKDQKRVLILRTNMGAGHGGDSGRFDRIKQTAREYAFAIDTLGISKRIDSAKRSTQSQKENTK
jgi:oligopeptidase B